VAAKVSREKTVLFYTLKMITCRYLCFSQLIKLLAKVRLAKLFT